MKTKLLSDIDTKKKAPSFRYRKTVVKKKL